MLVIAIVFGLAALAANVAGYTGCGKPRAST